MHHQPAGAAEQHGIDHQHHGPAGDDGADDPGVDGGEYVERPVEQPEEGMHRPHQQAVRAGAPSCGFSRIAHSAGLKVSELNAEMMVAVATVTANCL